jgi:hypothetical protein
VLAEVPACRDCQLVLLGQGESHGGEVEPTKLLVVGEADRQHDLPVGGQRPAYPHRSGEWIGASAAVATRATVHRRAGAERALHQAEADVANLRRALETRTVIGQATLIVMITVFRPMLAQLDVAGHRLQAGRRTGPSRSRPRVIPASAQPFSSLAGWAIHP